MAGVPDSEVSVMQSQPQVLAVGQSLRIMVPTPQQPDGAVVQVSAERDADGGVFLALGGLDCNLEGEQPGLYYLTPLA